MKILISSHAFAPSLGGIETVSRLLAQEFVRLGHQVAIVTQTPGDDLEGFPFPVHRRASIATLFPLVRWCDIFWQNNLSLRTIWPAFLLRKPVVITHQGSYACAPRGLAPVLRIKHAVVHRTTSVAISQFVARAFKTDSVVIPNPYDARLFCDGLPAAERPDDLVFVGRLVSEKGADILLESLSRLRARGLSPRLTVVGAGPELTTMQQMSGSLGLSPQISFVGPKCGLELANILHQHKILVVPSRYDEPFGVVALEGIACGCVVIGSRGGGLPEAIGPCGITFPNGDGDALAAALEKLLREPDQRRRLFANAPQHLARFHPATIADAYLNLFRANLRA